MEVAVLNTVTHTMMVTNKKSSDSNSLASKRPKTIELRKFLLGKEVSALFLLGKEVYMCCLVRNLWKAYLIH